MAQWGHNVAIGSMALWDQWYNGLDGTMRSMAKWVHWHDGINGTIGTQCFNRFNGKMGLLALGSMHSRSDGINGAIETSELGKVYTF